MSFRNGMSGVYAMRLKYVNFIFSPYISLMSRLNAADSSSERKPILAFQDIRVE
jgi:hypothetical protein